MRRITIAEGTAVVEINGPRATVRHQGRYVGQVTRNRGVWRIRGRGGRFPSAQDAGEVMVEKLGTRR